jgi:hypothetical protein
LSAIWNKTDIAERLPLRFLTLSGLGQSVF